MGNQASTSENNNDASTTSAVLSDDSSSSSSASGVFLSEGLQAKMYGEFESQMLNEEWSKKVKELWMSSNKRIQTDEQKKEELSRRLEEWREHDRSVQSELDSNIDALKSKFSNLAFDVRHDSSRLEQQIGNSPKFDDGSLCVLPRVEVSKCYNEVDDVRKCDALVEAMERCLQKSILIPQST